MLVLKRSLILSFRFRFRSKQLKCLDGQVRHNRKYCVTSNLRQTLDIRVKEKQIKKYRRKHIYLNGTRWLWLCCI